MRKLLLLGAAALMVPSIALADGEDGKDIWFMGVGAGWTQMDMPEYANGARVFGAANAPLVEQADVDGVSYGFGIGRDSASGWRVGVYAQFFDGDGSSSSPTAVASGTTNRILDLDGTTVSGGALGLNISGTHSLDVNVNESSVALSVGRPLIEMLRWDIVGSYSKNDTTYDSEVAMTTGITNSWFSNTDFETRTWELAGRLSANFGLTEEVSLGIGGSAGWGIREIGMFTEQRYFTAPFPTLLTASSIGAEQNLDGFIGRIDGSLNYGIAKGTTLGLTASYKYDEMVPVYIAPGNGTAASFTTESQSSTTYGLRLIGRF